MIVEDSIPRRSAIFSNFRVAPEATPKCIHSEVIREDIFMDDGVLPEATPKFTYSEVIKENILMNGVLLDSEI